MPAVLVSKTGHRSPIVALAQTAGGTQARVCSNALLCMIQAGKEQVRKTRRRGGGVLAQAGESGRLGFGR